MGKESPSLLTEKELTRRELIEAGVKAIISLYVAPYLSPLIDLSPDFAPETEVEPRSIKCRIHLIHNIADMDKFKRYIRRLPPDQYVIRLSALTNFLRTREKSWPDNKNLIMFTFDDGWKSHYDAAVFMADRGIPGVFAVTTDWMFPGFMDNEHKRLMAQLGMEVISHTETHPHLVSLRQENHQQWWNEIVRSKSKLDDIIGGPVEHFCYPYGEGVNDPETLALVSETYLGGALATGTSFGDIQRSDRLYILGRHDLLFKKNLYFPVISNLR